jgi:phytoene desaturase
VHVPFLNFWSMLRVAPQLVRLGAHRSVYSKVAEYVKDEKLRQAFSFHSLLVGGNPFNTSSIYTLIHYLERNWGVTFPRGGTGALVRGLVRLFEEVGGKLVLNAEVDQITTAQGRVTGIRLKNGTTEGFDLVVSNGEVMHTYRELLKEEPLARSTEKKLDRMTYSMSLFLIYFGAKKPYTNLAHHNVIFGPRYKELLSDIFKRGKLADDFSLYLHAPHLTDPSLAPEGQGSFYVLSPVPHLGKSDVDWNVEGPKYADKILSYLEKHYMPGLKENLVTQRIFTPLDFEKELNSHLGAAFSLEPTLVQSAYFRTHNRDDRLPNLYFVGAGTHPGAGLPGVVNSGKATAGVILEDFGLQERPVVGHA